MAELLGSVRCLSRSRPGAHGFPGADLGFYQITRDVNKATECKAKAKAKAKTIAVMVKTNNQFNCNDSGFFSLCQDKTSYQSKNTSQIG